MPVEALIYLGPDLDDGVTKHGDILAVKPIGSPWGTEEEQNLFVVATIPDLAIAGVAQHAATLAARTNAGEANPVRSYPFAAVDADGNITKVSSFFLDAAKLTAPQRAAIQIIKNTGKRPRLAAAAILNAFSTRP